MRTRKIGPFEVSAIGLGCMNMSMGYGPADEDESERLLQEALDAGYTFLDTASMYGMGHNEELIGRVLAKRRSEFVLASKCGVSKGEDGGNVLNGRPEVLRRTCEESLRRLQTDVIDIYYLHRLDPDVPVEESVGLLSELVAEGKIRTIGLSEVSTDSLRRAHAEHPVTALQSEYSLWSRTPERRILEACRELGVTFVPFSPLGRGFLTGKAVDVTRMTEDDLRSTIGRPRFEPDNFQRNSKLLVPFAEIAEALECTMAQLSLAWLLAKADGTLVPIPGTKHMSYMLENAAAADISLDESVVRELDQLINEERVAGTRYTAELMESIDSERD
ncbi:MAG: aldo/keto reductase [Candidatus Sedimenticola sp. PURPLELP]